MWSNGVSIDQTHDLTRISISHGLTARGDSSVTHQQIDVPEIFNHLIDHEGNRIGIVNRCSVGARSASSGHDGRHSISGSLLVLAIINCHRRTMTSQ
jgi:hypothetical protein